MSATAASKKSTEATNKRDRPTIRQEQMAIAEKEEEMLSEGLGTDEPDWRRFLVDDARDSPGIRARKLEEFKREFILWRCGLWEPTQHDMPDETVEAKRIDLARRTKEARRG